MAAGRGTHEDYLEQTKRRLGASSSLTVTFARGLCDKGRDSRRLLNYRFWNYTPTDVMMAQICGDVKEEEVRQGSEQMFKHLGPAATV